MLNISKILNDYLIENNIVDFETIYNDVFPDDSSECLISRYDPSIAKETAFIDGSAVGSVPLSYYCRSNDAANCREILSNICDAVNRLRCKDTSAGIEILFDADTLPNFISVDDKNNSIYTVSITAKYERKRK